MLYVINTFICNNETDLFYKNQYSEPFMIANDIEDLCKKIKHRLSYIFSGYDDDLETILNESYKYRYCYIHNYDHDAKYRYTIEAISIGTVCEPEDKLKEYYKSSLDPLEKSKKLFLGEKYYISFHEDETIIERYEIQYSSFEQIIEVRRELDDYKIFYEEPKFKEGDIVQFKRFPGKLYKVYNTPERRKINSSWSNTYTIYPPDNIDDDIEDVHETELELATV